MSDLSVSSNPLIVQPHPFSAARVDGAVPHGLTIGQIVAHAGLPDRYLAYVRVWVDDQEVSRNLWELARPDPGRVVVIKVFPHGGGGGGGKNPLATVLTLALMIAAPWAAGYLVTGTWVSAATLTGTSYFVGAAATVAIGLVGSMAINALLPPPAPSQNAGYGQTAPSYQITGTSNAFQPYGTIPRVLGKRRIYPMMAARPYTESQGNDQYIRLLLLAGYGPLQISDIKIGETPITSFAGVETEVTQGGPDGWSGNVPITLYTQAIREDAISTELTYANGWQSRTTRTNTSEISLDINFPRGLVTYNTDGSRAARTVNVEVQYRLSGGSTWLTPAWSNSADPGMSVDGTITATDTSQNAVVRSGRFKVAAAGQYEVQCRRTTAIGGIHDVDNSYWSVLRSIQHQTPVNQKQVCLIAVRIKATEQLNGVPNSINCMAEAYHQVWSGSAWSWQITRNPAWEALDILRRRGPDTLIPDGRLDLTGYLAFAAACAATAPNAAEPYWVYDNVVEGGSVFNALHDILSHARAGYTMRDGKHSVVMDTAQTVPVQHITPRNSWSYSGSKAFLDLPHALLVKFTNEAAGYLEDQVTVYADGYDETNATRFETVEYYGCTRATQAWRIGRYLHAVGQLRPELHTVYMDIESLRCTNGDLVRFAHDVILVGLGTGRIKSVTVNLSNYATALVLDGPVTMETGKSYGVRVRKVDGSSLVLAITTADGEHDTLTLTSPTPVALAPAAGDLFQFGESGLESAPMMVKTIERGPGLTAKMTLIDAQAGVWTADSGTIPAFNSYITVPVPLQHRTPAAPTFSLDTDIAELSDGTITVRIAVTISPPLATDVPITYFQVQYKESASSAWHIGAQPLADTHLAYLGPVADGVNYDVRVRSVTANWTVSDWTQAAAFTVTSLTTIGLPAPSSVLVFYSPDAKGNVSRAKVRATFTQVDTTYHAAQYLAFMVSVEAFPPTFTVSSDDGSRLGITDVDIIARGAGYTIQAGSTANRLIVRDVTNPLSANINLAGMYWAQYGASEWRKCTGYDATGFDFREPFDVAPTPGDTMNWMEVAWTDERPSDFRLAVLMQGNTHEVIRWDRITQVGDAFYLDGLTRAQEGTAQIDGTGGTCGYFPAPGAGTQVFDIPAAAFTDTGGGTFEGELDVNIAIPAGHWVAATAGIYRNTTSGIIRSHIVAATYGGPL